MRSRRPFSYANVAATLALIIALGGSAYAAVRITGANVVNGSLTGLDIKNGSITGGDIRESAINSDDVEDGSITAADLHDAIHDGADGAPGATGPAGPAGPKGDKGETGAKGDTGAAGSNGAAGTNGTNGAAGTNGTNGSNGTNAVVEYAEFFALMPPDNAATVAPGTAVAFPQNAPASGSIARASPSTFTLGAIGTYRVAWSVSVSEAGQLMLALNGADLAYTVAGRATGTSIISGEALVETTLVNSTLQVVNPSGNSTALTITPLAGGTRPVGASLVIERIRAATSATTPESRRTASRDRPRQVAERQPQLVGAAAVGVERRARRRRRRRPPAPPAAGRPCRRARAASAR